MIDDERRDQWDRTGRILAIRLDRLGDVLMTSPALRALGAGGRGRHVTLLTSTAGAAVASFIPEIDETIVYDPPWMKATAAGVDPRDDLAMIERLRTGRFDAAVIFTAYSQDPLPAALTCHLAGIPLRLAHCQENPYQLLTDWVRDDEPDDRLRHEVRRQLDLVASVGLETTDEHLSFRVGDDARARVRRLLRAVELDGTRPWAVIHPGASAASRRYPVGGFEETARMLAAVAGWRIVTTGVPEDREDARRVARAAGPEDGISLAGCLSLEELAALIAEAPVLISNNSGPVHLAAATGTAVVDLYALTNPQHTPWGVPARVLYQDVPCRFCYRSVCPEGHHACLTEVMPERVAAAALELVMDGPRGGVPGGGVCAAAGNGARSHLVDDPPLAAVPGDGGIGRAPAPSRLLPLLERRGADREMQPDRPLASSDR